MFYDPFYFKWSLGLHQPSDHRFMGLRLLKKD